MATITLGNPVSGTFVCTSQTGTLFDPDVVQVSFVKDHNAEDPTASLYEDTITFGGSEPRDNQLTRVSLGVYSFWYTTDRAGRWSVFPRWQHESALPGVMVTQTPCSSYLVTVQPTEHQFVDRAAMIPPDGGDPVSVPYATPTSGGMLTDAMAVKFAGIPADAQSAQQVAASITAIPDAGATRGLITTGASAAAAVAYYTANWAVTDWYINGATGNDANDGSEEHPLATTEELTARLSVSVPIAHSVTVHIAQGSYGTLAVRVIQSALACPFDVVGEVSYTDIGTVTSYTDRVVATNTAAHLVASGVADWTAHVGKRVDVLSGAQNGAVAWVGKVNPASTGVATAGVTRFASPATGASYTPSTVTPANGSVVALALLPVVSSVSIQTNGIGPTGANGTEWTASRRWSVADLSIGTLAWDSLTGHVDRCQITDVRSVAKPGNLGAVTRCRLVGRRVGANLILDTVGLNLQFCLLPVGLVNLWGGLANYCLGYGTQIWLYSLATLFEVGLFDRTGAAISLSASAAGQSQVNTCWGSGNGYGVNVPVMSTCQAATCTITGTSGDARIGSLYFPWTALPWVDGERSGEATLVGGTVDVTVPYVLSSQKIQASAKTFGGTPGFLSAVYVNATTIRITSSSATDTSVVTWHILPVGDNAAIRS